ncbi:uncharacterized protein LOC133890373 [Phragmites australis]|uniref:uncharacterized protein LOC133890373 n=1 Tax=Phragmites australis TaxID=29695 RepID=UPI002D7679B7|nr:uncharacterized protein LOC133890373 [Phragmites australis]
MDAAESENDGQDAEDNGDDRIDSAESDCFKLLNELSDLLMLPKDMLIEKSIRKEVCPSIGLPLVTRILCNFTPDEFCPDPVPGMVLEELNSEIDKQIPIVENALAKMINFPLAVKKYNHY